MLDAARHARIDAGHPLSDLRYETFGSSGTLPPEAFRVRLKGSDIELELPRERSMLDVLTASGFEVISDCPRGDCGLCAIDVVAVD
ncbi:2Fe-2S iron-sulfur cluster-binding protein, partial [Acinetobacter baumannii]|uniref:2Fe-2S iron-sulfur cluster-binding protein n=1 Tax=Acinetobacter baumannii TaxID=470 RepID=UPI001BB46597